VHRAAWCWSAAQRNAINEDHVEVLQHLATTGALLLHAGTLLGSEAQEISE
jgi:hypothetical protein